MKIMSCMYLINRLIFPSFTGRKVQAKTTFCHSVTVKEHFLCLLSFPVFVFIDIFLAIYFHGLQNRTMQEQCTVRYVMYGDFRSDLLLQIFLYCENREDKSLKKINWFTVTAEEIR